MKITRRRVLSFLFLFPIITIVGFSQLLGSDIGLPIGVAVAVGAAVFVWYRYRQWRTIRILELLASRPEGLAGREVCHLVPMSARYVILTQLEDRGYLQRTIIREPARLTDGRALDLEIHRFSITLAGRQVLERHRARHAA